MYPLNCRLVKNHQIQPTGCEHLDGHWSTDMFSCQNECYFLAFLLNWFVMENKAGDGNPGPIKLRIAKIPRTCPYMGMESTHSHC